MKVYREGFLVQHPTPRSMSIV